MSDEQDKAKQIHNMDQAMTTIAEDFPAMWKRMFDNLKAQGFTEEQAFKMVCTHIHGCANGRMT